MSASTLLEQHVQFIQRAKARGAKTLTYKTPCCGRDIEDRAAPPGNLWDTLCECPYCGAHYMKFTSDRDIVGEALQTEVQTPAHHKCEAQ